MYSFLFTRHLIYPKQHTYGSKPFFVTHPPKKEKLMHLAKACYISFVGELHMHAIDF
jgi:hypothetical protein